MRNFLIMLSLFIGYFILSDINETYTHLHNITQQQQLVAVFNVLVNLTTAVIQTLLIIILWLVFIASSLHKAGKRIEKQADVLGQSKETINT